jgi:hypothetical protein
MYLCISLYYRGFKGQFRATGEVLKGGCQTCVRLKAQDSQKTSKKLTGFVNQNKTTKLMQKLAPKLMPIFKPKSEPKTH